MSTRTIDYYEVLGVSRNATAEEIKSAFRRLAKIWHPDHHTGESEAEIRHAEYMFKLIHEAYECLINGGPQDDYEEYEGAGKYEDDGHDENSYSRDSYYEAESSYSGGTGYRQPFFDIYELKYMFHGAWSVVRGAFKWLLIVAAVILGLIMVAKAVMCIFHILLPLLIVGGIVAVAYFVVTYYLF